MNTSFWEQVTMLKTTDCWPWNGEHDESGRPLYNGEKAYRTAYQIRNGDLRSGNHVHHKCENSACVNPRHLIQLTPEEHRAAHQALRRNDKETLDRIYSGQWRIDSINYEEERRKREAEAAERRREWEVRCEEARVKLELEAQAKAKAKREAWVAFWADVRLAITIWAKYTTAAILLGVVYLLVVAVCAGRISLIDINNMSKWKELLQGSATPAPISSRSPAKNSVLRFGIGGGLPASKYPDAIVKPGEKSLVDPVVPAQEVKPPRATLVRHMTEAEYQRRMRTHELTLADVNQHNTGE